MHPELTILRDLLIVIAVAIPIVAAAQKLRLPNVVGFFLAGLLAGPQLLGLVEKSESVTAIAELGVVLLLFTIGMELSLSRIYGMGRDVLLGGFLQVSVTLGVVAFLGWQAGLPSSRAVFYGALAALSSTAVVLKVYADRGEIDTNHGRIAVSVLLFQDLAVVPLMLLAPLLAGRSPGLGPALQQMGLALGVVLVLVLGGRLVVPLVLERIVGVRNRELFTLFILLFGLSAAYLTASFGLSLALGAFLAGLVLSESEYGLQALSDILPFRDTFSGVFFISLGMLLDLSFLAQHLPLVTVVTLGVMVAKAVIAGAATLALQRPLHVAIQSGMGLAQVGEFSFVLALVGRASGILPDDHYQVFLATAVLTMFLAPLLIAASGPLGRRAARIVGSGAAPDVPPHEADQVSRLDDHVIIVGYGLIGRNLTHALQAASIPYVILEQNGPVVHQARNAGHPIYYGDGTRSDVLERVGIRQARILVYAIASPHDELRGVAVARRMSDNVRIIVRTRYIAATASLKALGADEVVPEEFETSIEIFAQVLRLYGVPRNVIRREVEVIRGESYEMLRGLNLPNLELDALKHLGVHGALDTLAVEPHAEAVGESPTSLEIRRKTGATIIAVVREGKPLYTPDPDFRFRTADTVVLVGDRQSLEKAAPFFRTPEERRGYPGH